MNKLDEITKVLQKNNNFLITSHINLDGDGIGSELALYFILKKLKKKPVILNQGKLAKIYDFLPGVNEVQYLKDDYIDTKSIDVGIVLDCSNVKRMGKTYEIFKNIKTIINIDHHTSNENFGNLNYVDNSVSSVGEIIYELINSINIDLLDEDISTCLFASKGNFDVNKFAGKFNGGGHPNAAGCLCSGKIYKIKEKILSELFKDIKNLGCEN